MDWRSCEGSEIVAWRRVVGSCRGVDEISVFVRRSACTKGAGGDVEMAEEKPKEEEKKEEVKEEKKEEPEPEFLVIQNPSRILNP